MKPIVATHYGADAAFLFLGIPAFALICGLLAATFALKKERNMTLCVLGALFSASTGGTFVASTGGKFRGPIEFGITWLPFIVGLVALAILTFTSWSRRRNETA